MQKRVAASAMLTFFLCCVTTARADVDWFTTLWHNDVFLDKDGGGYTNGLYFSWFDLSESSDEDFKPALLTRPLNSWLMPEFDGQLQVNEFTFGQAMMTPKNIKKAVPDEDDAPYGGLLMFRSAYTLVDERISDTLAVTVGIVGPSSGAEEAQRAIHKLVGANEPQGWDYQIKDEPVGQIKRTRVWRYGGGDHEGVGSDLLLIGSGSLGNLGSSLGGAVLVRYGRGLESSFGTAGQVIGRVSNPMAIDSGWNVYTGVGADYVYNQIFVSGGGLRSGQSADLRHDQYAFYAGASYAWKRFSLTLSYVNNSKLDKNSSARQEFGALKLGWKL
ncbi:lipid A deacylase LpxR family protein [Marinimicrobium agarilyticum]|uniref:lipid A deacylase LpxR family protein n=1 Tax=Marinimicrobium agarilyticum TaxID=306546 RepID=UPI00041F5291|nr:lipid A deacylase LpxR family protein [Marinimicrobium agarilyticum]